MRFALLIVAALVGTQCALAQAPVHLPPVSVTSVASSALPEPIYWKQHLFLIPYQWGSAAQSSAAKTVTLVVSKDRGASWQKISDARPDVKSFNYRAEGDGEYWFAVRTLDNLGRWWPEGAYQPELRVIVDTAMPRIDTLTARLAENGTIEIECRATDVNLDPASLAIETQSGAAAPWQAVSLQAVGSGQVGLIQARFLTPGGALPAAIRAKISDRAGNSAVYQTGVGAAQALSGPALWQPLLSSAAANPFSIPAAASGAIGGAPFGAPGPLPLGAPAATGAPAAQPWAASAMTRAPFRLWTSGLPPKDDGMTAYGGPQVSTAAPSANIATSQPSATSPPTDARVPAHYAGATRAADAPSSAGWTSGSPGPSFATLEPFRETAAPTTAVGSGRESMPAITPLPAATAGMANNENASPPVASPPAHRPATQPKLVGSRTFALEYDLDGSECNVSRVELWGTRDGGQSWNRFAQDDDNRSPLVVTVDDEGSYGFKILVQTAGGAATNPPRPGEEPELWVTVDLKRPIVELTSIERGEGNLADHLVLHWRAQDNNLEPRPISLYFSSRRGGPWSAIATNLEDTGEYTWRVERYVPTRIYLRIEARDTAGNLAAFQTRDSVETLSAKGQVSGHLRTLPQVGGNR